MNQAVGKHRRRTGIPADRALGTAAGLWFFVTVVGQWAFLYYIIAFYATSIVSGNLEAWNRNPFLFKGYVAGDLLGNTAFAAHVLLAAVIAFGGALQLIPQIRARAIGIHRWNGRLFLTVAVVASVTGLYMVWVRDATVHAVNSAAISLNAGLIILFAGQAWRAVRSRDIASHRRWAIRTFLAANGVFFLRLGVFGWLVLNQGRPVGMTSEFDGAMNYFFEFASYLLPLAVFELYWRAKDRGGVITRFSTMGLLVALTAYMAIGIFAFYMFMAQRVLAV